MNVSVRSVLSLRGISTAVSTVEKSSPAILSSEFFDHIRYKVYGDSKKVDKVVINVKTDEQVKPVLINRNVSTPFHCFNHISKQFTESAVLVEVVPSVGTAYFSSVNQPLQDQAEIRKIGWDSPENVNLVNEAYWRSCSLVTAAFLKEALNVNVNFEFPSATIQNGYFAVVVKGLDGTAFTIDEMNTINRFGKSYIHDEKLFEMIAVPKSVAQESGIHGENLVRIGQQVFTIEGPVISSTSQIGRFTIFRSKPYGKNLIVGGVSIPHQQKTSSYSWGLIAKNAIHKFSKS